MKTVRFKIMGRPQPRGSKRAFMRKGMKFPVIVDDNAKSKPWMQEIADVALVAMACHPQHFEGPVMLAVDFYFSRPKGHFGKNGVRPSAPAHHVVKPDTTKLMRGLEDALKGICWRDDSQVVQQVARKLYGSYDHTVVTISDMGEST